MLLSIVIVIAGCATPAPDLMVSTVKHQVNVSEISVIDLSTPNDDESWVWRSGFIKIADIATNPPFGKYVYESMQRSLKPMSEKNTELLDIMLLSANLLMEVRIADSLPFIGIASVLTDREYACSVEINLKQGSANQRKRFESKTSMNRGWGDIDPDRKKEIVEHCVEDLVQEVAEFANKFITDNTK